MRLYTGLLLLTGLLAAQSRVPGKAPRNQISLSGGWGEQTRVYPGDRETGAVVGISYGPMMEVEGARDVIASAIAEAATVARACGVAIPQDLAAQILKIPAAMPNQKSSTAQDLARGKPSEIDFLNGAVVRLGATYGVECPVNQGLTMIIKAMERASPS